MTAIPMPWTWRGPGGPGFAAAARFAHAARAAHDAVRDHDETEDAADPRTGPRGRPGRWGGWGGWHGPRAVLRAAAGGHGGPGGRGHHPGFPPPHPPHMPPVPPGAPHGPWGGGPFPPNPFEMFGGGRRRGGPRARRGDVRTGILLLLAEEPRSGYEVIREGRERSGGAWRPSPGSVYPMLQQLEDEGLVRLAENAEGGRRRPFELTDEGHAYVERHAAELTPPWDAVPEEYEDALSRYAEISALAAQLSAAAAQVAQAGTEEQVERAKRLLGETKRGLYRILAEEDPAEEPAPGGADGSDGPDGTAPRGTAG
ncbi:PadR family transcriptional regulator [Streptomonospora nanhaiensis]|uniref:PadR family transcriptional regulator n=1 Tax=Streptomonospora nanhaiensis TaxID=1323731 RepID=UPI001C99B50E|nr:PadR family transcriptional regulator [Streptomonospora nanhaiensis]MBX9389311.1 PadR family transcriptional regulator [Streptomonospora nanhaiensis]